MPIELYLFKVTLTALLPPNKAKFLLDNPKMGLLIPEGIWAHQIYIISNSVLTVLCNRKYETDDYIRDYEVFKKYRSLN